LREDLRRFIQDRGGNFAMLTAIVLTPLLLGTGLALDVTNIARKQNELQQSVDAAVLAITREGATISDQRARDIAARFLGSNFDLGVAGIQITRNDTKVELDVRSDTDLAFGGLFGKQTWPIQAVASADIAYIDYEIGLVLDTTGSMKGGKLASLKDAATKLVTNLSGGENNPRMRFALVPFANFVNVGSDKGPKFDAKGKQIPGTGSDWLDLKGDAVLPQSEFAKGVSRFQLYNNMARTWPGCVETRYAPGKDNDVSDAPPSQNDAQTLFVPALWPDEPDDSTINSYLKAPDVKPYAATVAQKRKRWAKYGVATDSSGIPLLEGVLQLVGGVLNVLLGGELPPPPPVVDDSPAADGVYKGPERGCVTKPIVPLTSDIDQITAAIDALEAKGSTNIPEGVSWGTRVLSPGEPFGEGRPATTPNLRKIMIVLTDGSNQINTKELSIPTLTGGYTRYRDIYGSEYSSYGFVADARQNWGSGTVGAVSTTMNGRALEACKIAKAAKIEIYTIRLEEPDVKTGTLLKECATDAAHYLDVPDHRKLDEAFSAIRVKMIGVRLTQ
jgi:Flp pilus assembly protein TadG